MYNSPINIEMMTSRLIEIAKKDAEENIYSAVMSYGIDVDKDELLRALRYDREQYDAGFAAGYRAATPKWIPVTERLPTKEDATEQGAVLAWEVSVRYWDIWAWDCVRDYADRFVGWMPLPQPPIEEQNREMGEDG